MMYLFLFIFATIGLTNIMVHGKIMEVTGVKCWLQKHMSPNWFQLFECYECSGVWAGWFCGVFFCLAEIFPWWLILMYGFAGSVFAQTYTDLIYFLRSKIEFTVGDSDAETTGSE